MLRIAACGLLGLGAGLLIAALLLSTYTSSRIQKIPLDLDTTLISSGTGTALDPDSLTAAPEPGEGPRPIVIDEDVPLVSQRQITAEAPANARVVTLQSGMSVRRGDKQGDAGLLLAGVSRVTIDRNTAEAVTDGAAGALQSPVSGEFKSLEPTGLTYRFPFGTEKKTYQVFDSVAQKAFDANYEGEDDVNGLTTYKFSQNVGYDADGKLVEPIQYVSLYDDDVDAKVTAPASVWGLPGEPDEPITMDRFYAAQRTFWVDPVTGTIVKSEEHANHFYVREGGDPLVPDRALADYQVSSTQESIEDQVAAARDERDRVALWSRILPITFTAAGLVSLIAGALLGSFSLRAEAALIDPGLDSGGGFLSSFSARKETDTGPMPAAEAETEKLPAQRPDLHPDADPPDRK